MSSSSSSTDESDNEDKEEQVKQVLKLLNIMSKKRKKNNTTSLQFKSMSSSDSRISSSKRKEHKRSLKYRLIEYLKQDKYIDVIKWKMEKSKERINEQELYDLEYNEDGTKVKIKETKESEQLHVLPEKINEIQDIDDLHIPAENINKKELDKNGNIGSCPNKHINAASTLFQAKLNIDDIVEKCANKFKDSIKNAILELANSVNKPDFIEPSDGIAEENQLKPITNSTNTTKEESLLPCKKGTITDETLTENDKNMDIQDSNNIIICLDEETDHSNYIENDQSKNIHLNEKEKSDIIILEENVEEIDNGKDKAIEEEHRLLDEGREIFENSYQCPDYSEDDEEKVKNDKKNVTVTKPGTSISTNVNSKKTEEVADSNKEKSENKELDMYINVEMVNPIDTYLSSLPQYQEYKTDINLPESWYEGDKDPKQSKISDDEIISIHSSDDEVSPEDSKATERPVATHFWNMQKTSDDVTKNKTSENTNEKPIEPKLKDIDSVVADYISSIRQKYEEEIKKGNCQGGDEENEKIKCQERIDKEQESFEILPLQQQHSELSSYSSSEETDDEVFKNNKKTSNEVSGKAQNKTQETKRSSTPVMVYHYYNRKVSYISKEETTTYDSDDSCVEIVEAKNPLNLKTFNTRIGPRTPPPQDSSSDGEIHETDSEETELNIAALGSLHSRAKNRVPVLKEQTFSDPRIRDRKSSNRNFKVHYESMTIVKSLDTRTIIKRKN